MSKSLITTLVDIFRSSLGITLFGCQLEVVSLRGTSRNPPDVSMQTTGQQEIAGALADELPSDFYSLLWTDALLRDLTINALYFDPRSRKLIDPLNVLPSLQVIFPKLSPSYPDYQGRQL